MKHTVTLLLAFLCLTSLNLRADSPLTSTDIANPYSDVSIVKYAQGRNGVIDNKIMKFLSGNGDIGEKAAVVNALGWNIDGQTNAASYQDFLLKKYKSTTLNLDDYTADEVLCLAYLKAMDDYNDVTVALSYAEKALEKNPTSYTVNIIHGIITAQFVFSVSWCSVYQATNEVRLNTSLNMDMRESAVTSIFLYMDLYNEEC